MDMSKFKDRIVHFRNSGMKGLSLKYGIRPNYRTDPYKRTVKQFLSLQITDRVLLFIAL